MAIINIVLNYGLIFGNFGLPNMGIKGAALASVIAEACSVIFLVVATLARFNHRKYALFTSWKFRLQTIGKTLKLSVFIMLQNLLSIAAWFIFFIIIEKSGERPLAISNIIRSVYNIILLPIWAFSSTANTFVSNLIGERKEYLVIPVIKRIAYFSIIVVAISAAVAAVFQNEILSAFTNNPDLVSDCRISFYIICMSSLAIAAGYTVFSGISGTGKTYVALFIEIIGIIVYLFSVYLFSRGLQLQIEYAWLCEFTYGFSLLGLAILYLKFGKWKHYRI